MKGFRYHDLGQLVRTDPKAAATQIRAALEEHGGVTAAAEKLGVTRRSLYSWCRRLEDGGEPKFPDGSRGRRRGSPARKPREKRRTAKARKKNLH